MVKIRIMENKTSNPTKYPIPYSVSLLMSKIKIFAILTPRTTPKITNTPQSVFFIIKSDFSEKN